MKQKRRKFFVFATQVAVIAFFMLIAVGSGGDEREPRQPREGRAQNNAEQEAVIGSPIEVGHFIYTIDSFEFRQTIGSDFSSTTADGIFLIVNLSVKNVSDRARTLSGSSFSVTDSSGVRYAHSTSGSTALMMAGYRTLFLDQFQPNINRTGVLVFEVPARGEYYLHLAGDLVGGGRRSARVPLR